MLLKFLVISALTGSINGFTSGSVASVPHFAGKTANQIREYSLRKSLLTFQHRHKATHLHFSSLEDENEDIQLYLRIGQTLYEVVSSLLTIEGIEGFVYCDNKGGIIVSDEFVWKMTQDLDAYLEKTAPDISPRQKRFFKAALREVSKQDIASVIEDLIEAPIDY